MNPSKHPKIAYFLVILIGCVVLLGWIVGSSSLTQIVTGLPSMKVNSAISFIFLGTSAFFFASSRPQNHLFAYSVMLAGLILPILTLYEYISMQDLGIDEFLFKDIFDSSLNKSSGRMSSATAICFVFSFLSLAFSSFKSKAVHLIAQLMLHLTTFLSAVSIFSYLLFIPTESSIIIFESMAIHTSLNFFLFSIGLSLAYSHIGFSTLFTGKEKGNRLARNLFIRILALITILSILQLVFLKHELINKEFSVALFGVIFIWVSLGLIRSMSLELNSVDNARREVVKDLHKSISLFEAIAASILIIDLEGTIYEKNKNALKQFGYDLEELAQKSISTLIPDFFGIATKSPSEIFLSQFDQVGFVLQQKLVAVRKNGDEFHASIQVSKSNIGGKNFLVVSLQDLTAQEALENELTLNSDMLSTAAEFSQIGFWEYDVLQNKLIWGPSMYNLFNLNKEDFTGDFEAWEKSLMPEDLATANKEFADALSGKTKFDTSFRIIGSGGIIKHIRAKAKVFKNDQGIAYRVLGTNWDVTKEKEAELAIEKSNQQMLIFVEQAPSAIAMFDTDMRYITASKKWVSDYALEGKEFLGVSHYTIFPEIGEDWKEIHRACLAGAINTADEAEFKREDGSSQWLSWDVRPWYNSEGEIGGLIMNTANITAQKENIRQRLQVEQILEKTNEIALIGTWELNLTDNAVVWSKMLYTIHEAPEDFIPDLASGVNFYKEGPSRDTIVKAVNHCLETGESFDHELELVTLKGNGIWVRAIGNSETGAPNASKLFGVLQDITERKKDELALNSMLTISNDQNERLRNYAHIVSHNLRSHSGNINMMLDLIAETYPTWTEEEMFQMLQISSSKLRDTITHLNEVVAIGGTVDENLQNINLRKSVDACIDQIRGTAKDAQVTIQNLVDDSITILGLAAYVDSMLVNLISNGIKYRSVEGSSFVRIEAKQTEQHIEITVQDNGQGIDLKKYGDKLFGMYKTFHGNKDARGIGLFITKNQIAAMGGSIEVTSKPNKGTTFTIIMNYEKN